MATSLSLITEYIARQADPKDNPSIVFWALGELRRVQTSTSSIGEVLTNHDEAIKAILLAIGEGGDGEPGLPGNCDCEDGTDGTDGQDGQDGRGVMVFQQSTVPSSSLSEPGDIWFSDNDILIMDTTRAWQSISGGSSDIINDSIVSLATTWSSSRLVSEFDQYLRKDEARHKLYGLMHTDVDTAAMIEESHGLFYQTGKFRPDYRMDFVDPYVLNDTYYPQQTVLVEGWTMCANKETTEYPAPAPIGDPLWASGEGDTPAWSSSSDVATQLQYGQRYTAGRDGYILGGRFWVDAVDPLITYSVWLIVDPLGNPSFEEILPEITPTQTGWNTIPSNANLTEEGTQFDVIVMKSDHTSETSDTTQYNYSRPNNEAVPTAGQIIHANKGIDTLRISNDSLTGDYTAILGAMQVGDEITGAGITWNITFIAVLGTYYEFTITPAIQGTAGNGLDFTFTTYQTTPINYQFITDHYIGNANAQGLYSSSGYDNIVVNENMYGIDLEIQDAYLPDDWDVVAPGDTGSRSSAAQSLSDKDVRWVRANSTQLRFETVFTTDAIWTELARYPIDVDTGAKATLTIDGMRTDAVGMYSADITALAFNNGGVLGVDFRREELGQANLDCRVQSDGADLVFEVKGRNNQDWKWGIAIFFRDIN